MANACSCCLERLRPVGSTPHPRTSVHTICGWPYFAALIKGVSPLSFAVFGSALHSSTNARTASVLFKVAARKTRFDIESKLSTVTKMFVVKDAEPRRWWGPWDVERGQGQQYLLPCS